MEKTQTIAPEIQKILDRLVLAYSPQKVILFGSHAAGHPREDSDIDLLIIKDTTERFIDRWTTVHRILTDTTRKIPLDTLILTPREIERRLSGGDQFIKEILDTGIELYAA